MTSYLTDRNLQAVVGGATSSRFPVTAGVPQGSILGPTLLLVYVNYAEDILPPGAVPATYADDTTLYVLIPSVNHAATSCNTLQTGMDALAEWGKTWRSQFEPSESQAMTITRHDNHSPLPSVAHRSEGSNELPSFANGKFRIFLVRFTSAPCLVVTRPLCSSNKKNVVERDVHCQRVHDSRVVGVGTTSTEV